MAPELLHPHTRFEASYLAARNEFLIEGHEHAQSDVLSEHGFAAFVASTLRMADPNHVEPGFVPQSAYWLVDNNRFTGRLSLRHFLNDNLRIVGGHIGYDIRPSERGQGYGKLMLQLGLQKARELGLDRVLLTCNDDDVRSIRVIERNGGVLADTVPRESPGSGLSRRYWIDL